MIKVGIIGATGYVGGELVRILAGHKDAEIVWYGSRSYIDKKYADVYQNMFQIVDAKCLDDNMEELAKQADVIFTATPQGFCASMMNDKILSETKIIDLSADFRIKDVATSTRTTRKTATCSPPRTVPTATMWTTAPTPAAMWRT